MAMKRFSEPNLKRPEAGLASAQSRPGYASQERVVPKANSGFTLAKSFTVRPKNDGCASPGTSAEPVSWPEPATSGAAKHSVANPTLSKANPTRDSQRAASRPPHPHCPLAISEISCPVLQLLGTDQPCPASLTPSERLSEAGRSYRIAHSSNGPRPFHQEADWQPAECLRRRSQA